MPDLHFLKFVRHTSFKNLREEVLKCLKVQDSVLLARPALAGPGPLVYHLWNDVIIA